MFGVFKSDPQKALRKRYDKKLEEAMHAQRRGDIKSYAFLSAEAESIWIKIKKLNRP
ncbi:Lacal_2735 family protein [Pseudoalteromonas sp. MMG013]|uniref:Lacal_2735 family protein n=1 Tax=Pseudoalteromonas aurantia 208 TaxID=1314867 RepID=A0ABR9EHH3_9GAMM|nr:MULTISPECIES: DUF6435 family protein [Pseudoalteromonas]MBE0369859.1 hypothetical protein [Pseudoalteromonas aurantia 208]MBQ4844816.1 Lacal_2735 family protein [Pseudoalteromonas sp. MMG005]MBQ4862107.1 Lacal_2735 family protein [Pseudoalteromonas sp. MMG013]